MSVISWDDYFMSIAILSSMRSKDPSTKVGCCIVDQNNHIVGVGYNGMVNCVDNDSIFPWSKSEDPLEDKHSYVVHAEANAILNSYSSSLKGCRIYSTLFPCNECCKLIIQSGISKVYYLTDKNKPLYKVSKNMMDICGVEYINLYNFSFPICR